MSKQPKLNLWGKGIHQTKNGHLKYHSRKDGKRDQYVHRVVFKEMLDNTHPLTLAVLTEEFKKGIYEVHHIDFNKVNNKPDNLLGLSVEFHAFITAQCRRKPDGTFASTFTPKWKQQREFDYDVPF